MSWVWKIVAISAVLHASACSSVPRVVRRQVDVRTLEEVRVEGQPKWAEAFRAENYQLEISEVDAGPDARLTARVTEGRSRSQWSCQTEAGRHWTCSSELHQRALSAVAQPWSREVYNHLALRTSRTAYQGFRYTKDRRKLYHGSYPEVLGIFRTEVLDGEPDPETNARKRVPPVPTAFLVREEDGVRLFLPRGDEFRELRALLLLSVGALNSMGWGVKERGQNVLEVPNWR